MNCHSKITISISEVSESPLFALSPELLCIVSGDGYFRELNPVWEKTFGFTNRELQASPYTEFIHPEDRKATIEAIASLSTGSQTCCFKHRFRAMNGSYKWLSWKAVPLTEGCWYAIAHDITACKLAEAKYRSIYENAVEGIFQTTPDGNYLSANRTLARIYGYEDTSEMLEQLTDIEYQLYVDPNRRPEFRRLLQENDIVSEFESEVYRQDGSIIWIRENARSVRDEGGNLLYYEGFVEDITERKQAEAELEQSLSLLRATLESTVNGILAVDLQGLAIAYNQKFIQMWGLSSEIMNQGSNSDRLRLMSEQIKDPQAFITQVNSLYDNPASLGYDILELKDGRIIEHHQLPQRIGAKIVGRVSSFCDITERQKIGRMKNEFVSMVSHELRTPLTSIRGSLSLIVGGVAGEIPPQVKALVEIGYKNSERLVLLINDILDIEKIESGKMDFKIEPVQLIPLVQQAIEANIAYGEQFDVKFKLHNELNNVWVKVDSDRLMQVLTNLLSNAAKFSPQGETVAIAVTLDDRNIRVEVRDRGPGISEEFRPKIFQKFAQADSSDTRQKGGTGLGLSISKAIIEKLGGQIGFESDRGAGTTFYFILPQWQELPPRDDQYPEPAPLRILICENDRDTAKLLSLMLSQGGFDTDIAYSAMEAKQLLAQPGTNEYAAMTIDLAMPDTDGISLIRELRQHENFRHLPIVVVSAKVQQDGSEEFAGSGFAVIDWLDKPIDQGRLIAAVKQAALHRADRKPRILHIEDDPDVRQVVSVIVGNVAEISHAANLQDGQQQLATQTFDLVILDLELPDGSGWELLPQLKCQSKSPVPVVVFSAQDVGQETARKVAATLVKSRTSNQDLLDTISTLIANGK
ncbi:MAG: PAS domain S-box protein [Hormoscilla sp.]